MIGSKEYGTMLKRIVPFYLFLIPECDMIFLILGIPRMED